VKTKVGQKWYCSTGIGLTLQRWIFFVILSGLHLVFTFFLFPVSTAQIMSKFWKNRRSGMCDVAPIVLTATANFIGAASPPALMGEAWNIRCAYRRSRANS
jgi:hypothetical protein